MPFTLRNTIGTKSAANGQAEKIYNQALVRDGSGVNQTIGTITALTAHLNEYTLLARLTIVAENSSLAPADQSPFGEYLARFSKSAAGSWVFQEFITVFEEGSWNISAIHGTLTTTTIQIILTGPTGTTERATIKLEVLAASNSAVDFITVSLS